MVKSNPEKDNADYQKKLAEQLSEKTSLSSREIEEGVERFISKSQASLEGTEIRPPYQRPIWYEKFFRIIQQRSISKVTLEFISLNITSRSETYKFQNGLRFLHLIDNEGNTTELLEKLRVSGSAFSKNLNEVIHLAYSNLFENIVLESAEPESIVNYMIGKYSYSQPLAEGATELFVYFCKKANIALSQALQDFGKKAGKSERKKPSKQEKVRRSHLTSNQNAPIIESQDSAVASLKSEEFSITVKKDIAAINLARFQINSFLDYWVNKLKDKKYDENSPSSE
jgi:hypothetical protein